MNKIFLLGTLVLITFNSCTDFNAVTGNCNDGILNLNEQEIDCGGVCAPCTSHCSNGIMDEDELGVDCGGIGCVFCPPPCSIDEDVVFFDKVTETDRTTTINDINLSTDEVVFSNNAENIIVGKHQDGFYHNPLGLYQISSGTFPSSLDSTQLIVHMETWPNYTYALPGQTVYYYRDTSDIRHMVFCELEFDNGTKVTMNALFN